MAVDKVGKIYHSNSEIISQINFFVLLIIFLVDNQFKLISFGIWFLVRAIFWFSVFLRTVGIWLIFWTSQESKNWFKEWKVKCSVPLRKGDDFWFKFHIANFKNWRIKESGSIVFSKRVNFLVWEPIWLPCHHVV